MKFYNWLNEETNVDEINKAIQKDCQPYLRLIKQINNNIFTRSMEDTRANFGKKKVRKNRKPQGMKSDIFKKFNKWLQKNGHNRRDKSVSVSAESSELFGARQLFFPIGKFSYSWISAKDVNVSDKVTGWYNVAVDDYFLNPELLDLDKSFAKYFHTDEGISTAYKNNFEVWFNCDAYYYVETIFHEWDTDNKQIIKK